VSTKHLLLFLLFSTLTACGLPAQPARPAVTASTASAVPTSTASTIALATSTLVSSPTFTATPAPTRTATRWPKITSTPTQIPPTKTPTITPTSVPIVAAPPGLIYSDSEGQWQVAANGRPTLIITGTNSLLSPNGQMAIKSPDCCNCVCDEGYQLVDLNTGKSRKLPFDYRVIEWSPDSRYIYYITNGNSEKLSDVWRWDVATGEKRNLTHTPDRDEGWWLYTWPQRPDTLVFYSTEGFLDGEGWIGFLTIVKTDGTGYKVVSNNGITSPAAFSPDGRTIAYVTYETLKHATYEESVAVPWYYRVGAEPQRFPWQNFGLAQFKTMNFSSPAWSPDGQKIAWWIRGEKTDGNTDGIGIFDLTLGRAVLLNDFVGEQAEGWNSIDWSPDGKRILFFGGRESGNRYGEFGVWAGNVDGTHLRRLIATDNVWNACRWIWRPDGQWLAFQCDDTNVGSGIWLAELDTGKLLKTNLPDDAQIRGWVSPQP
jgi:Tol biopolymer transport system component